MITSSETYYYHYDGLGNVIALSDSSGNLAEYYKYDAFGKVTTYVNQGPDNTWLTSDDVGGVYSFVDNPYYFTGRRLDRATFNYYYRARYYSPSIGRFLSADPIGYYDSMNLYQYCGNNPVNFVDPWGEAYVKSRPLDGFVGRSLANKFYDKNDERGEHWQIMYDDGSNSGYFKHSDKEAPKFGSDKQKNLKKYDNNVTPYLNDKRLKQAETIVQGKWEKESRKYNHPYNDCHTYINEVLREYLRLKDAEKIAEKINPSQKVEKDAEKNKSPKECE